MYRNEDIEKIEANIDKIKNDSTVEYKTHFEPTIKEISKVYNAIKNYIINKKKVVYGGFAQNLLIITKNPDDGFYKEVDGAYYNWPDIADLEFYSPTPIEDMIDLCNELHKKGFKHVQGKEGVHEGTYKIFVNFINYCDISYTPKNMYDNIPTIDINGVRCSHPHYMMVDAFRILTDPMTSYWRIEKPLKRFQKLIRYYPIDRINNKIEIKDNSKEKEEVLKYIRKRFIHNSKLIVVGFYGYNYYVSKDSEKNKIKTPYYELITTDIENDGKKILLKLLKNYGKKITIREFYPFVSFLDKRVEYYYDNELILKLYSNNDRCIVYNFSETKKTHFGTYNLVFMYLLFNYFNFFANRDKPNTDLFRQLISNFHKIRKNYLTTHNKTVMDKSPFQDFTLKCYGFPVDQLRKSFLEGLEKIKKKEKMKFTYDPSKKIKTIPKLKIDNISGSEITSKKDYIIHK